MAEDRAAAMDPIARGYVELALALDRHLPGYAEAYYGPPRWQDEVQGSAPPPLSELARRADGLVADLAARDVDDHRREYLDRQLTAMRTSIDLLQGVEMPLREEAERLFDVTPPWTDESELDEALKVLDELLPGSGPLPERAHESREEARLSVEALRRLVDLAVEEFGRRTREKFPLPEESSVEIAYVDGKPWPAYHWYLGGGSSRVEICTDWPLYVSSAPFLIAHELFPGHHTEAAIKERLLYAGRGWQEHCILPIHTPAVLVSEGIAERARQAIMPDPEWIRWHTEVLYPAAGLEHLDAERRLRIAGAQARLNGVYGNAVFLAHDRGKADDEVVEYFCRFGLASREAARQRMKFIRTPALRAHYFTYLCGAALLDELFAAGGDPDTWFARLLQEPVTPGRIRRWIAEALSFNTSRTMSAVTVSFHPPPSLSSSSPACQGSNS